MHLTILTLMTSNMRTCRIHSTIEEIAYDELQKIMSDATSKAAQDVLLQAWESDSRKCFAADQEKNGMT